ncbi:hypothetical protein DPMN_024232 [Dreissena polymorpha]|uniref:Uncharacterized protein n=1 Tax=Dreissena polymorpha TaxID=45954 RepID=A0A9D4LM39_DREPO|nr:hypothetical protein DPMN_024232 [Dreissena polymorpha]
MNLQRHDILIFMLQNQQHQLKQAHYIIANRSRRRMRVVWNICVRDRIARRPQLRLCVCLMVEENFMKMLPAMYDELRRDISPYQGDLQLECNPCNRTLLLP